MNRYSAWKYVLIGVALFVGIVYTLPNFFPEVPAVQVSTSKANIKIDNSTLQTVESALRAANIAYRATTNDNIVGTPSQNPVTLAVGSSTPVNVTFTTDDGNLASGLSVDLSALPSDWSGTSGSFACPTVSTGNTCQLGLLYSPTAMTAPSTLSLTYSYNDDSGTAKTGSVSIDYSAP